jgi:hypothetical protein
MIKHALLAITFLFSINSFSQQKYNQVVRGTVTDTDTKTALPGASVQIAGTTTGTITDADGSFRFTNVAVGRYSFIVSFIGYNPVTVQDIIVSSSKEVVLNLELKENVQDLAEVKIVGTREKSKSQNDLAVVSTRTFSIAETERYAGSLGDPSRMAKNFAGISTGNDERNDIIIRGNSPLGLLWRLDGFSIPNPNHFGAIGTTGGPISILNNNLLTNSDFFTSAFPAEYGNATSGVFDLRMRNGNNEKHEYVAQAGFNGFEFGAEGPFTKTSKASFIINYRYSMLTLLKLMGLELGKKSSEINYQDMSFKVNLPLKHGSLSLIGIGGLDGMLVKKTTKRDTINNKMGFLGLSYVLFLNQKSRLEIKSSVQYAQTVTKEHRLNEGTNNFEPDYISDFNEPNYTFSVSERTKINSKNNFSVGANITRLNVNFADSSHESKTDNNGAEIKYWQVLRNTKGGMSRFMMYGQWQHNFTESLSLTSGINYLLLTYNNTFNIEPKLGLKFNINDRQSISLGTGLYSRTQPTIIYLSRKYDSNGIASTPYKDLDLSKNIHGVIGYDLNINKQLRLKIETYYQYLYRVPVSGTQPQQSLINYGADFEIVIPDDMTYYTTGRNYGVEVTVEKFLENNFYYLVTGSLFESKYFDFNKTERNTSFNNNFIFNGLVGYELPVGKEKQNSITFNLRGTYAGGNPKLPIDLQQSIALQKTVYDWSNAYNSRYPNYFRLDFRFGFRQNKKNFSNEFAIDIQNITNHQNILRESFDDKKNIMEYDYQYGFFPMALYRITF